MYPQIKRLVIFLLLAFGLSWVPAMIFNKVFGYHEWFETNKMPVLFWTVGYGPALANVITRKLTHEGWHDSMLHLNLKGNIRYYIIAIVLISVLALPQGIIATLTIGGGDSPDVPSQTRSKERQAVATDISPHLCLQRSKI